MRHRPLVIGLFLAVTALLALSLLGALGPVKSALSFFLVFLLAVAGAYLLIILAVDLFRSLRYRGNRKRLAARLDAALMKHFRTGEKTIVVRFRIPRPLPWLIPFGFRAERPLERHLLSAFRDYDTVRRIGFRDLAILLEDVPDGLPVPVRERLVHNLPEDLRRTIRVGIATQPPDGISSTVMLQKAESRLAPL